MSAHWKAFIIVFFVSVVTLVFFRKPFSDLVGRKHINNWSLTWLVMTSCAYLLTNYWLFLIVSAGVLFVLSRSEPVKPAIYLLLLSLVPTIGAELPGFAGINKLISINPQLMISAVVLIPLMFASRHMRRLNKVGANADLFFLLFLILQIALAARAESFTHVLRIVIQQFLSLAPLYYVFSRYPKSFDDIRVLSTAFILPVLALSAVSMIEIAKSWQLYYSVSENWFGEVPFAYVGRGGYVRASASVFNPIVWGFVCMCALGVGLATLNEKKIPTMYRYAAFALIIGGLLVSLSRGPWIGAAAIFGAYILLSKKMITRSIQAGAATIIAGSIALVTPFGKSIISFLPIIGSGQSDNTIDYRQALLEASWGVMLENPLFGDRDFLSNSALQPLRQGQGIIDIVNTYLQVGLHSGFIGLGLFLAFFASIVLALRKALKTARAHDPVLANYCRAYLATLIGILLTIFTTSNVGQISDIMWIFGAMGIALSRVTANVANGQENTQAAPEPVYDFK